MTIRATVLALAFAMVAQLALAGAMKPTRFTLAYRAMEELDEVAPVKACAVAGAFSVEDTRAGGASGVRFHEDKPEAKADVTVEGSATDWAKSAFEPLARRVVLRLGVEGRPRLTLRIADLWLEEQVYKRAEYDGRVVLDLVVSSPDGSRVCYEHRADGFAENYGWAGKAENYQETVNEALDRAIIKLLQAPEVSDAICGCGS